MEARAALDMRTTSLPLEAAATFLPDSHLARGVPAELAHNITAVSADVSSLASFLGQERKSGGPLHG